MFRQSSDMDYRFHCARSNRDGFLYTLHASLPIMTGTGKRRIVIAFGLVLLVSLAIFYFIVDPGMSHVVPQCVFHRLTGLDCPGCGSQRMVHDLLHADFRRAWHHNAFLLCLTPVILIYIWLEFFPGRANRLFRIFHSSMMISLIGISIIAWGIIRNILR